MLFHYHFWTPNVEETEKFYIENGFRVTQRVGKKDGEFQSFDPPLNWEDFRGLDITFRIIEVRKGAINITFGYGKKVMFDHIGFLVTRKEHDDICKSAKSLKWNVHSNDRRTFIGTPYNFRIELQTNRDAIDEDSEDAARIEALEITVKDAHVEHDIRQLLKEMAIDLTFKLGKNVTIHKAMLSRMSFLNETDPNGVSLITK
ncbi:hypothetical protein [Salirhabdus sp. Marseille-P4669]|uniref:hypothetical protein n=1 Tax=Salirhabdus sp. Marseille-P4669 TaxID=2042310 RepID=UPI000C7A28CF|nr:hypothetical protein [Salirhabdus sp. Marseille-P4669]